MAASSSGPSPDQLESLTPPQITLLAALLLAVGLCKAYGASSKPSDWNKTAISDPFQLPPSQPVLHITDDATFSVGFSRVSGACRHLLPALLRLT